MTTQQNDPSQNKRFQEPESTRQHLEFIQGVITRLNANSFQIKNWHITILSGLVALSVGNENVTYLYVAVIPSLMFWFLDAYYLQQERKFREVYKGVLKEEVTIYSMPIDKYQSGQCNFWKVFMSSTICPLYFIPLIVLGFIWFTQHWHCLCCIMKCLCKCNG